MLHLGVRGGAGGAPPVAEEVSRTGGRRHQVFRRGHGRDRGPRLVVAQPRIGSGEFTSARRAVNHPRGPRPEGEPILVGTDGPRMLRLTARYADAWNTVWHNDPAAVVPLLAAVDAACREVGRAPETLVRTADGNIAMPGYLGRRADPITGGAEEMAATLRGFRDLGLRHFVCGLDPCTPRSIERFGRVIDLLDRAK